MKICSTANIKLFIKLKYYMLSMHDMKFAYSKIFQLKNTSVIC